MKFLSLSAAMWQNGFMKHSVDIPDDLNRRLDLLAARSTLSREQIVEDALSRGRSLAWREKWVAGIAAGVEDADRGDFADDAEIAAVLNMFGPA